MITFIVLALLMVLLALLPVLWPLLRITHESASAPVDANIDIFQQHVTELNQDLAVGLIDQQQYDSALTELKRRLLDDTQKPMTTDQDNLPNRYVILGITIALPVVAVMLYLWLGDPRALNPDNIRQAGTPSSHRKNMPDLPPIDIMADRLENRLRNKPDLRGWLLLADTRRRLRQYDKAAYAYEQALKLKPGDPDILVSLIDIRASARNGVIDTRGYQDLLHVLKTSPRHPKALWLAGTWAYANGRYRLAIDYWQRLRAVLPAGSEDARINQSNIDAARKKLGLPPERRPSKRTAGAAVITGTIDIAPALIDRLPKQATLFILARAVDGPRAPLAVYRIPLGRLPVSFRLDDSLAMRPDLRLSNFKRVIVIARISVSGHALARPGDLEGRSGIISLPARGPVKVLIDRVVGQPGK